MFQDSQFWNGVWVTSGTHSGPRWWKCSWALASRCCWAASTYRFSRILRVARIFPLMVAPVIGTIIWQLMLSSSVGIHRKVPEPVWPVRHAVGGSAEDRHDDRRDDGRLGNCPFVIILILAGIQSLPQIPV
jgi:multiple sugar transport system permease protein